VSERASVHPCVHRSRYVYRLRSEAIIYIDPFTSASNSKSFRFIVRSAQDSYVPTWQTWRWCHHVRLRFPSSGCRSRSCVDAPRPWPEIQRHSCRCVDGLSADREWRIGGSVDLIIRLDLRLRYLPASKLSSTLKSKSTPIYSGGALQDAVAFVVRCCLLVFRGARSCASGGARKLILCSHFKVV
jgi:hypothetical protein